MSNTHNYSIEDRLLSALIAFLGTILFFSGMFLFDVSFCMWIEKIHMLITIPVGGIGLFGMLSGISVIINETLNIFKRKG